MDSVALCEIHLLRLRSYGTVMGMASVPLPTVTPLPVLIKSSDRASLDGVGTLFTQEDTEITGLHVVSKGEALIRLKRAHPDVRRVCIGLTMLQRAQKEREWPVFQEAVDVVRKWVPHFWGDAEVESLRSKVNWKKAGWTYSSLMSNLLQKSHFIIWYSTKDEGKLRPGLFCPDWEVAIYAVVGMDHVRRCEKPGCDEFFIPEPDTQKYCTPAHGNARRVARAKEKAKKARKSLR